MGKNKQHNEIRGNISNAICKRFSQQCVNKMKYISQHGANEVMLGVCNGVEVDYCIKE